MRRACLFVEVELWADSEHGAQRHARRLAAARMLRYGVHQVMLCGLEDDVECRERGRFGHHRGRKLPARAPHSDVLCAHALLQDGADRALDEQLRRRIARQQAEQLLKDLHRQSTEQAEWTRSGGAWSGRARVQRGSGHT